MSLLLGAVILFGIPAGFALLFWAGPIKWLAQHWEARDVMNLFRPDRRAVAAEEQRIDDIYLEVFDS